MNPDSCLKGCFYTHKTGSVATLSKHNTYYAITVKNNLNSYVAYKEDIDLVMATMPYEFTDINYEIDPSKRRKLHVHAKFRAPKNLYRKSLMRKGWHVRVVPWYSHGWKRYSSKDQKEDQLLKHKAIHFVFSDDEV